MKPSLFSLLLIDSVSILFFPHTTNAQAVNLPNEFFLYNPNATTFRNGNIGGVISLLLPNAMVIAGVFFVFLILYGGYQYVINSGQMDSVQVAQKAQRSITQGAIGLLLVVAAYFILQIIGTITGINFISSLVT